MRLKHEMAILDIDGRPMAVPVGSGDEFKGVLHMNGTSKDIIEILKEDVTEAEIIAGLKKEYDATEEEIRHNVEKVLGILREHKLLVE